MLAIVAMAIANILRKYEIDKLQQWEIIKLTTETTEQINKISEEHNRKISAETKELFENAQTKSFGRERELYSEVGKHLNLTPFKMQLMAEAINKIDKLINVEHKNISLNKLPINILIGSAVNEAILQVTSGSTTYVNAIKKQVQEMALNGLQVIRSTGKHESVDVVIRRGLITGLKDYTIAVPRNKNV